MLKNENVCTDNQGFFAAANSGRGFISFYKQIFGGEGSADILLREDREREKVHL